MEVFDGSYMSLHVLNVVGVMRICDETSANFFVFPSILSLVSVFPLRSIRRLDPMQQTSRYSFSRLIVRKRTKIVGDGRIAILNVASWRIEARIFNPSPRIRHDDHQHSIVARIDDLETLDSAADGLMQFAVKMIGAGISFSVKICDRKQEHHR